MAFGKEFFHLLHFDHEVILCGTHGDLDMFHADAFLGDTLLLLALRFFIAEFVVAHHARNWRFRIGGDFNEVDAFFWPSQCDGLFAGNYAEVFAVLSYDAQFERADLVVDAWFRQGIGALVEQAGPYE